MPAAERFDVLVVGGGAAGVAAAVGARRAGATVCLLERYPFLGGAATASSVLTFCGFFDQRREQVVGGVGAEVLERLRARGVYHELAGTARTRQATALADLIVEVPEVAGRNVGWTGNHFVLLDLETTKLVYDEIVADAGVAVRLHTTLVDATRDGQARLTGVTTHGRGGIEHIRAGAFVDTSGDGALIVAAGAGARVDPPEQRQTATLVCRFGGVTASACLSSDGIRAALDEYARYTGAAFPRRGGILVRLPVTEQVFALLVDEQVDALDAQALTAAEMSGRRQAWRYLDAFRRHLDGWERAHLVETGPQIGVRESRHLHGRQVLTRDDVVRAVKRPAESIGRCGWPVEDHPAPGVTTYTPVAGHGWYDIPYGAICSADTDNLWAAGRLVAADRDAYASVRVMGAAFATGHAAGVAAAGYTTEHHHEIAAVRAELHRQHAIV